MHVAPGAIVPRRVRAAFARRLGVAFIANFDDAANADAARFLVGEVMPLVWARDASIPCVLGGDVVPDSIRRLARPGVEIGDRGAFDRVRLAAAPLRFSAGLRDCVIAGLAAGLPCVMTAVAAEGLDLPDVLASCVGGTAVELADVILQLHGDGRACRAAGAAAIALVKDGFGAAELKTALKAALAPSAAVRAIA